MQLLNSVKKGVTSAVERVNAAPARISGHDLELYTQRLAQVCERSQFLGTWVRVGLERDSNGELKAETRAPIICTYVS